MKNITMDEWRDRERKDRQREERRQNLLNDLIGRPKMKCKNCGVDITWSSTFGWYHGTMSGGWNSDCINGEAATRAEPDKSIPETLEAEENRMANILQNEAKFTSWDYVHYDRQTAMTIVQIFKQNGWGVRDV
jgi:hypothetical protein